jgi:hypothetical protein
MRTRPSQINGCSVAPRHLLATARKTFGPAHDVQLCRKCARRRRLQIETMTTPGRTHVSGYGLRPRPLRVPGSGIVFSYAKPVRQFMPRLGPHMLGDGQGKRIPDDDETVFDKVARVVSAQDLTACHCMGKRAG